MNRIFVSYPITDPDTIKRQMLSWTSRFNICAFLDNHAYDLPLHTVECLCAAGVIDAVEITAALQKNPSAVKGPEGHFRKADPTTNNFVANLAAGIGAENNDDGGNGQALERIDRFKRQYDGDWIFGHLGYGLTAGTVGVEIGVKGRRAAGDKTVDGREGTNVNQYEETPDGVNNEAPPEGGAADPVGFPDAFFFVPEVVIELGQHEIRIGALGRNADEVMQEILQEPIVPEEMLRSRNGDEAMGEVSIGQGASGQALGDRVGPKMVPNKSSARKMTRRLAPVEARFSRDEYIATVEALRQHILRGDCYEINFCQEFYSQPAHIDPVKTWFDLDSISPSPFSAFYRMDDRYLLCASPERYLKRSGDRLYSQPIKGTSPRFVLDPVADEASRDALFWSAKDRSENVMVVDLVRNDLSRVCRPDTVRVSELYGIYSFPQVHQMISTIEGDLEPGMGFKEVLDATFPMGSMTGAPKKRVVELIAQYERTPRGIFSGAVGYIRPGGDFDFNVVIRSILYNRASEYLCWLVGSGITFYSDPALEYEECMTKAQGMKKALGLS